MPLYVGDNRINRTNLLGNLLVTSLETAWTTVRPLLRDPTLNLSGKAVLCKWRVDHQIRRYGDWDELARAMEAEITGHRENYFFGLEGENLNVDTVIFRTEAPTDSIGWTQPEFFQNLGHAGNRKWSNDSMTSEILSSMLTLDMVKSDTTLIALVTQALRRRAEQEYLMMNMVKGAMWDASQVADEYGLGVAVRGTGLLAHMGIESGDPTKAQEYKNKTSKEVDLILCEEMEWSQLGAVVHYDPRVEWNSRDAEIMSNMGRSPMFLAVAIQRDWEKKKLRIPARMIKLGPRIKRPSDSVLEATFMSRSKEYFEEDHEYRKGHYAPYTTLVGPYIRLKARNDVNMVGDHDLFAFTHPEPEQYGIFMPDTNPRVALAQKALQKKPSFQAQHGGIWYWKPGTAFNIGIKSKIMGAHGPEGDEPLVYIRPGKQVTAAYYTSRDNLASVWSNVSWTKWMSKTFSGNLLLNPVPGAD